LQGAPISFNQLPRDGKRLAVMWGTTTNDIVLLKSATH